jgi:hypothetical protein
VQAFVAGLITAVLVYSAAEGGERIYFNGNICDALNAASGQALDPAPPSDRLPESVVEALAQLANNCEFGVVYGVDVTRFESSTTAEPEKIDKAVDQLKRISEARFETDSFNCMKDFYTCGEHGLSGTICGVQFILCMVVPSL